MDRDHPLNFLRKPELLESETMYSYLWRVSKANHYQYFSDFLSLVWKNVYSKHVGWVLNYPIHMETYQKLGVIFNYSSEEMYNTSIHCYSKIYRNCYSPDFLYIEQKHRLIRLAGKIAFCPNCLQDINYFRLHWHLKDVTTCEIHNCYLVDCCPKCGFSFSEIDILSNRCPYCNFDLCKIKVTSLIEDPHFLPTTKTINYIFNNNKVLIDYKIPKINKSSLYIVLYDLKSFLHFSNTCNLEDYFDGYNSSLIRQRNYYFSNIKYSYTLNVNANNALINWPHGFYSFLDKFRETYVDNTLNLSLGLGYLYKRCINSYWNNPEFTTIQSAYNSYLLKNQPVLFPGIEQERRYINYPKVFDNFNSMTLYYARKYLEIDICRLKRLVEKGKFRTSIIKYSNQIAINKDDIDNYKKALSTSVNLQQTVILLGSNEPTIVELINRGHLNAISGKTIDDSYIWLITIDSINKLKENIKRNSVQVNRGYFVTLGQLTQQVTNLNITEIDLIEFLISGKIKPFLPKTYEPTLKNILFPKVTSQKLKASILAQNNWHTRTDAAKKLCVKPHVLKRWIKSGLIEPIYTSKSTYFFSDDEIKNFELKYIKTHEASKILGLHKLTVQTWARKNILKPVSGNNIDGCHEYRFIRSEIETIANEERLTSTQKAKQMGLSRSQLLRRVRKGLIIPISGPETDGLKHRIFI